MSIHCHDLIRDLIEKSKEAFIMGLEIYNKPTLMYRVEGFSFFICNAWELMLKAKMIQDFGEKSIYYKDNPHRTITLERCIQKIFTNNKDPLRLNLERIIELRNTSTHFIVREYEQIFVPLFQSCVMNYSNKLLSFFNEDITKIISQNFLTLSIKMEAFEAQKITARYPPEVAQKLLKTKEDIWKASQEQNEKFSINIEHQYYLTKDKKEAVAEFRISSNAKDAVFIATRLKDPNNTHPFTAKSCISQINDLLDREAVPFIDSKGNTNFNQHHFQLFTKFYNFKDEANFCYVHRIGSHEQKTYSQRVIDFILNEIKKDPENIIRSLKNQIKKSS